MTFTSKDAHAVQVLLDYYLDLPDPVSNPSEKDALQAWMQLSESAQEAGESIGWRPVDVQHHFQSKSTPNPLANYSNDAEQCDACDHTEDVCPYHRGMNEGASLLSKAVTALVDDPDQINDLLADYAEITRGAEPEAAPCGMRDLPMTARAARRVP